MTQLADSVRDWSRGIPSPWTSLDQKVVVRPGGLCLVVGAPGALKSMTLLNWVMHLSTPTLYLSFDTSKQMQAVRVISYGTGHSLNSVYAQLDDDAERPTWVSWLEDFDASSKMKMIGTPCTAQEVGRVIEAWSEYWGETPTMTIVDDVEKLKGVKDYQSCDEAITELGRVAKRHNTVIMGVQHLNRGGEDATKRPKLRTMKYTGEYEAAYVLGLWRPSPSVLRISVLKNRTGEDDPLGNIYAQLHVDAPRVLVREQSYREQFAKVASGS